MSEESNNQEVMHTKDTNNTINKSSEMIQTTDNVSKSEPVEILNSDNNVEVQIQSEPSYGNIEETIAVEKKNVPCIVAKDCESLNIKQTHDDVKNNLRIDDETNISSDNPDETFLVAKSKINDKNSIKIRQNLNFSDDCSNNSKSFNIDAIVPFYHHGPLSIQGDTLNTTASLKLEETIDNPKELILFSKELTNVCHSSREILKIDKNINLDYASVKEQVDIKNNIESTLHVEHVNLNNSTAKDVLNICKVDENIAICPDLPKKQAVSEISLELESTNIDCDSYETLEHFKDTSQTVKSYHVDNEPTSLENKKIKHVNSNDSTDEDMLGISKVDENIAICSDLPIKQAISELPLELKGTNIDCIKDETLIGTTEHFKDILQTVKLLHNESTSLENEKIIIESESSLHFEERNVVETTACDSSKNQKIFTSNNSDESSKNLITDDEELLQSEQINKINDSSLLSENKKVINELIVENMKNSTIQSFSEKSEFKLVNKQNNINNEEFVPVESTFNIEDKLSVENNKIEKTFYVTGITTNQFMQIAENFNNNKEYLSTETTSDMEDKLSVDKNEIEKTLNTTGLSANQLIQSAKNFDDNKLFLKEKKFNITNINDEEFLLLAKNLNERDNVLYEKAFVNSITEENINTESTSVNEENTINEKPQHKTFSKLDDLVHQNVSDNNDKVETVTIDQINVFNDNTLLSSKNDPSQEANSEIVLNNLIHENHNEESSLIAPISKDISSVENTIKPLLTNAANGIHENELKSDEFENQTSCESNKVVNEDVKSIQKNKTENSNNSEKLLENKDFSTDTLDNEKSDSTNVSDNIKEANILINDLQGMKWLKTNTSDSTMNQKTKLNLKSFPKKNATKQSNDEPQMMEPSNSVTQNVWNNDSANKLFPNAQSVVIDREKEEEEFSLALAESICTAQLESERRKTMEGNLKIRTEDDPNDHQWNKVPLSNLPEDAHKEDTNNENVAKGIVDQYGRVKGFSEKHLFMGKGARRKEQAFLEAQTKEKVVKAQETENKTNITKNQQHSAVTPMIESEVTNQMKNEKLSNKNQERPIYGRSSKEIPFADTDLSKKSLQKPGFKQEILKNVPKQNQDATNQNQLCPNKSQCNSNQQQDTFHKKLENDNTNLNTFNRQLNYSDRNNENAKKNQEPYNRQQNYYDSNRTQENFGNNRNYNRNQSHISNNSNIHKNQEHLYRNQNNPDRSHNNAIKNENYSDRNQNSTIKHQNYRYQDNVNRKEEYQNKNQVPNIKQQNHPNRCQENTNLNQQSNKQQNHPNRCQENTNLSQQSNKQQNHQNKCQENTNVNQQSNKQQNHPNKCQENTNTNQQSNKPQNYANRCQQNANMNQNRFGRGQEENWDEEKKDESKKTLSNVQNMQKCYSGNNNRQNHNQQVRNPVASKTQSQESNSCNNSNQQKNSTLQDNKKLNVDNKGPVHINNKKEQQNINSSSSISTGLMDSTNLSAELGPVKHHSAINSAASFPLTKVAFKKDNTKTEPPMMFGSVTQNSITEPKPNVVMTFEGNQNVQRALGLNPNTSNRVKTVNQQMNKTEIPISDASNSTTLPNYRESNLIQNMQQPQSVPCANFNTAMDHPSNTVMNVNALPYEAANMNVNYRLNCQYPTNVESLMAVPYAYVSTSNTEVTEQFRMNHISNCSVEISRLNEKVARLSEELASAQAELLAAQSRMYQYNHQPIDVENQLIHSNMPAISCSQTISTPNCNQPMPTVSCNQPMPTISCNQPLQTVSSNQSMPSSSQVLPTEFLTTKYTTVPADFPVQTVQNIQKAIVTETYGLPKNFANLNMQNVSEKLQSNAASEQKLNYHPMYMPGNPIYQMQMANFHHFNPNINTENIVARMIMPQNNEPRELRNSGNQFYNQ